MLHILLSRDHITLCDEILKRIESRVKEKTAGQLLIVPEQYSFDMERRLAALGDDTCLYAEVLSLSRLAGRVESVYGGAAELRLDQGGRLLTADLAVDQAFSRLKFYAAICRKPEFLENFLAAVDEWESYNLLPKDLLDASKRFSGSFAQKLEELGLLYESYHTACGVAQDPILRLRYLCDILESEDFLADKELYIYGFSDFTALEHEILEACIAGARNVTLALPREGDEQEKAFPQTDALIKDLDRFCREKELRFDEAELSVTRERSADLAALQDSLSDYGELPAAQNEGNVSFYAYRNTEEECRAAASRIRSLLRSGARCREIGVACADVSCRSLLRDVLRDADIPAFFSGKTALASNAGARIVLLALRAIEDGLQTDDVLSYLKSGVADDTLCDDLENYAVIWNIRGNAWLTDWEKNPSGVKDGFSDAERARLERINETRSQLIRPLADLRDGLRGSACVADMVRAVYSFMQEISLSDRLLAAAEAMRAADDDASAQQFEQVYDLLLGALEQLCLVDGAQVKDTESFCSLMEKLLERYGVASIPGTLDQVLVADVPSFRGRSVRHLFILGASEGAFPSCGPDHGIFTETERKQLKQAGVVMAPTRDDVLIREINGVYQTIRSAEATIRFSCTESSASVLLLRLAEPFGKLRTTPDVPTPLNPVEAASFCLRTGCKELPPEAESGYLSMRSRIRDDFGAVSDGHLLDLYREELSLSPTSSDLYASCRFSYFLRYGLNAKPRETAQFDQRQFGSFVHGVLENMVNDIMRRGGFRDLPADAWQPIAEAAAETYVRDHFRDLRETDGSTRYFIERARREAFLAAKDLFEELHQSEFIPYRCELRFGSDPEADLPEIPIAGKRTRCLLRGSVDRVDVLHSEDGDYIRVVDYKTGSKCFDYTYYLLGKEMQLVIYLSALKNADDPSLGDHLRSAGVLYQPVGTKMQDYSEAPTREEAQQARTAAHKRRGVILQDPKLWQAMEENYRDPKILPLKLDKNGNLVTDEGDILTPQQMQMLEDYVCRKLGEIADGIKSGDVTPNPIQYGSYYSCTYCKYQPVCQKDRLNCEERRIKKISPDEFYAKLREEAEDDGR